MTFKNIIVTSSAAALFLCANGVASETHAASNLQATRSLLDKAIQEQFHHTVLSAKHSDRNLNFAQCLSDTNKLFDDSPALVLAQDKVNDEMDAEQDRLCGDDDQDFTCIIDEDDAASNGRFRQACGEAGGRVFEYNRKWQCTVSASGESATLEWHFLNVDFCAHPACNRNDVIARLEQIDDQELDNLASSVSSSTGATVNCDGDITLAKSAAVSFNSFSYLAMSLTGIVAVAVTAFV